MKPEDFKTFVNCRKDKGNTAFLDVAENGRLNVVISLLETYDAEQLSPNNDQSSA